MTEEDQTQTQNTSVSVQHLHKDDNIGEHEERKQIISGIHPAESSSASPTPLKRKRSATEALDLDHPVEVGKTSENPIASSFLPLALVEFTKPSPFNLEEPFPTPTTPSSINPVLPLTTYNLRKFREESGDSVDSVDMATPQQSKTTSKLSKHVEDVRQILRLNDMPVEADGVLEAYPKIMATAETLLENPRHSPPPTKEQLANIQKTRKKYATRNETTFIQKFFGVFRSISRQVNINRDDLQIPAGWETRDWEEDGLDENDDKLLRDGSVPKIVTLSETQRLILNDLPHISNPKPDILYGYNLESFTAEEDVINARYKEITEISEGIAHPFFDIEVKTHGDPEEATNVACTGGAALVQAHRLLEALVASTKPRAQGPIDDKPYADTSTVAYSMVLAPRIASIYVHWAEVKGPRVVYHMHCAGSYAIERDKSLKECRAAVNNILDWGLTERRRAINGLLRTLHGYYKDTKTLSEHGKGSKGKGKQTPANKRHRMEEDEDEEAGP